MNATVVPAHTGSQPFCFVFLIGIEIGQRTGHKDNEAA